MEINTITKDELYKKYGKDIVFLFKGTEPWVKKHGHALGVLIEKDNKVLCNECGKWFERLGGHLNKEHGMYSQEYKEKYGFNKIAPLCSAKVSKAARERTIAYMKKDPYWVRKRLAALQKGRRTMKRMGKKLSGKQRMQALNKENACPEQMKQRYFLLRAKYGDNISLNTIRRVDSGIEDYARRHFGGWNKWKKTLGFEIDTSSKRKNDADLIFALRDYVKVFQTLPWNTVSKRASNDFPYSMTPYLSRWGSLTRVCLAVGIYKQGWLALQGNERKAKWQFFDFDNV